MRLANIALLFIIALLAAGCGGGAAPSESLDLGPAPWSDGERTVYDLVDRNGNKLGTIDIRLTKEGAVWIIDETDTLPQVNQAAKMRVDAASLKPLGEDKTIKSPQADVTLSTEYKDGKLNVKAKVNGEDKQASVDVPDDALDNDQLVPTLRALQFKDGLTGKFTTVVGANAATIPTTVRVVGKETVETPVGSIEAWKTELEVSQGKQYFWYQVAEPHHLVLQDNGNVKMVLVEQS